MSFKTENVGLHPLPSSLKPVDIKHKDSVLYGDATTTIETAQRFHDHAHDGYLDCALCNRKGRDVVKATGKDEDRSDSVIVFTRTVAICVCSKCRKSGDADKAVMQLLGNWSVQERRPSQN